MKAASKVVKDLKNVWHRTGEHDAPKPEDVKDNVQRARRRSARAPSQGGVMVSVRVTPEEKKRLEMLSMRDDLTLGELLSHMLTLYEEKHGKVALPAGRTEDA